MERFDFDPQAFAVRRRKLGFSQRVLAERAGVSQSLIAELERGKHPPSEASLQKLALAMESDPFDFQRK